MLKLCTCAQRIVQHCSHLLHTLAHLGWMLAAQQMLLEHGATTNKTDSDAVTPLLACIEAVHNSTARLAVVEVGTNIIGFRIVCAPSKLTRLVHFAFYLCATKVLLCPQVVCFYLHVMRNVLLYVVVVMHCCFDTSTFSHAATQAIVSSPSDRSQVKLTFSVQVASQQATSNLCSRSLHR